MSDTVENTTVLIVDDQRGMRLTLSAILEDEGYETVVAENIAQAIEALESEAIDVVITDLFIELESGLDLIERIHKRAPDLPIILITGDPSLDTAVQALRAGAFNYLFKPVTADALSSAVVSAAKVKKLHDDNKRLWLENQRHRENLEELVEERTQALKTSERKYRLLADNARDMIWRTDFAGTVEWVNPAVETLLGYTVEEATGRRIQDYLSEESRARSREWILKALKNPMEHPGIKGEVEYIRKDGSTTPAEFNITFIRDDDGRVVALEGVTRDISSRKKMEKRLRDSEYLFRSITEQSPVGILIVQDLHALYANNRCAQILGHDLAQLETWLPGAIVNMVHPDDLPLVAEQSRKKQRGETDVKTRYALRLVRKDEQIAYLALQSNPITFKNKPAVLVNIWEIDRECWERDRLRPESPSS